MTLATRVRSFRFPLELFSSNSFNQQMSALRNTQRNSVDLSIKPELELKFSEKQEVYERENREYMKQFTEEEIKNYHSEEKLKKQLKGCSKLEKAKERLKYQLKQAQEKLQPPRQPRQPFIAFCMEQFGSGLSDALKNGEASRLWKGLSEEEKKVYKDQYESRKNDYLAKKSAFEKRVDNSQEVRDLKQQLSSLEGSGKKARAGKKTDRGSPAKSDKPAKEKTSKSGISDTSQTKAAKKATSSKK